MWSESVSACLFCFVVEVLSGCILFVGEVLSGRDVLHFPKEWTFSFSVMEVRDGVFVSVVVEPRIEQSVPTACLRATERTPTYLARSKEVGWHAQSWFPVSKEPSPLWHHWRSV